VHLADQPDTSTKAGFVVSRAIGNAVTRNKVRRRLRHLIRDRLASLPSGTHLVVRAQAGAADRSYRSLAADLDAALVASRGRTPRRPRGSQP
jgi:ribonuclease P protein component